MKKIMVILIILSASLALTGCSCNQAGQDNPCDGGQSIGNWY